MAETTAQLKRKRESAIGAQKKAKKQRKSDATAAKDAAEVEVAIATPVAEPTQEPPQSQDKSKSKAQKSQANGVREQETPKKKKHTEVQQNGVSDSTGTQGVVSKSSKKQRDQEKRDSKEDTKVEAQDKLQVALANKTKKPKHKSSAGWALSSPQGGWFLPTDPVFSMDEKYLLLANAKALQIYSTDTSTLVGSLPTSQAAYITAYALSSVKPNQVYVADSSKMIILWDWVDGKKIGRWDIGATIRNMTVITQPGTTEDLVYCHETGDRNIINVHALRTKASQTQTEVKCILKIKSSITDVQVLLQGKYVILSTADTITVGKRLKTSKTAVQDFEYVWRELKFSKRVTTCNTYFRQPQVSEKGKKTAQEQRDVLDLAVGDQEGAILLFEDILASFAAIESSLKGKTRTDSAEDLRPKRYHWHRDAVGAVKWSPDGNYLISGGDETVLNIWQLATGKCQHLPHLSAAIENVVVSPTGSSYAISLANNSVIVLSTSELEAKTNIVGLQTRRVDAEQLPKESKSGKPLVYALVPVPMTVDPSNTQQVLFTVPSSQPRQSNEGLRPEPYLQTFDVANQRPVGRQALTRNNATDPNMAPEGHRIIEPSVKFVQISHDGQWLATVDEWLLPRSDTAFLDEGNVEFKEEQRSLRREVFLKLWRRDEKNGQWALETRIDAPHFLDDVCGNGRVLDLVAHPTALGFATIGEDHVVRVWTPKTRVRDGVVVRGAANRGLVTWSLHRVVELPNPDKLWLLDATPDVLQSRVSRLAFSPDGSVLAAGVSGTSDEDRGLIHLIDVSSASIRRSMVEIDATALCGVGIVGHYLVAVTDSITVWDLVTDDLVYCASITTTGVNQFERISVVRFATNEADGTFAVSLPQFEKNDNLSRTLKKVSSKICVYGTISKEPLWSQSVPGVTLALAARKGESEKGYIALDSVSNIRTISPTAASLAIPVTQQIEEVEVQRIEVDETEEVEDVQEDNTRKALGDLVLENDYDKPVVTQQDLEEIFHNDGAPQAPKDVFSAVLRLFGGVAKAAA
ncbi:WD40-repeat-containing domain protein [Phaeosphaeria sp. MPI-PUGE-AT-0046c]|nr:WD40-repeat-containing domain protein [Phaeosphaeria sp. MPI-PUGE-AT-0046c]